MVCNGIYEDRDDVALYFGKGLLSHKLHDEIQQTCTWPNVTKECDALLDRMDAEVGTHNVYNIYDNCPNQDNALDNWLRESGMTMRTLRKTLRRNPNLGGDAHRRLLALGGGYTWTCGQFDALPKYFARSDVRAALNMPPESKGSTFDYDTSGPASIVLYPELIRDKNMRVLIYNGDADSCVPYIGNEEWTSGMVQKGVVNEKRAWHPWYSTEDKSWVSGYATTYDNDFTFVTIRLAGHQVRSR